MEEARKRRWEVWLGLAGSALTVVGILIGVWQFNRGQTDKVELENSLLVRKDEIDFKRRLWLERLTTYRAVAETAGKVVARADDPAAMKEATKDFVAAYWGAMIFVEDAAVERAMIDFSIAVDDFQRGWADVNKLKYRADQLIKACRASAEQADPRP